MKSQIIRLRGIFLRLLVIVAILTPTLPVQFNASAQGNSAPARVVRSLHTNEFGVKDPKGLAFSSTANSLILGSTNTALVTMGEDNAGTLALPEAQADPLNVAFDKKSGSLFALNRGKSELVKVKADSRGLPTASALPTRYASNAYGLKDPQGIAFDPDGGRLFVLDAGNTQIVSVAPHATMGFDANEAIRSNKVQKISLKKLGLGVLKGLAYNPSNGHLYVTEPARSKLYELTQAGDIVSTFDLASLGIKSPSAMTFAPSGDNTDDPNIYDLFILDDGQTGKTGLFVFTSTRQQSSSSEGQIVELSFEVPMALPPGTTVLPATLVRTFDTSVWSHPSTDPSGIEYWPSINGFVINDSEVEESVGGNPPVYWHGYNVFLSTLAGNQIGNCTTYTADPLSLTYNNFSNEPTGVTINSNNNHIFYSHDGANGRVFEVGFGQDGNYCTSDDTVTRTFVATLYGATDAEDVAYGNNTLYISDGINAEVYNIPLGANGILGGGDDGPVTHFDTAALGFNDLEGIGYNSDSGTLFIVSTQGSENYLGEVTTSGALVNAYNLSFMGTVGNIRSDVTYAPGSQNQAIKNIYIVSRGVDNNSNPNANDGKVWEISISGSNTPAPSLTPTQTNTPSTATNTPTHTLTPTVTSTFTPTLTRTPTLTFTPSNTPTATPTFTPTLPPSSNPFYSSFAIDGTVGGVTFADEDILQFNGTTWSLFFDGSDVGVASDDVTGFYLLDADSLLLSFDKSVKVGSVTYQTTDIVRFDATSLGATTAGTFSMYFNGADVGLSSNGEDIDAIEVLPDNRVLISTTGDPSVTGATGAADEDILAFTPTTLGTSTSGTWAFYFDGSDVGLADSSNEDIDLVDVASNGNIFLSTIGLFSVTGVSGDNEDVFICTSPSVGSNTACTYSSALYFDGSTWGQSSNDVDAFNLIGSGVIPTATPSLTPTVTNTSTPTSTATQTGTPTNTFTPTNTSPATDTPTELSTSTPTHTPTITFTPASTSTSTNTPTETATIGPSVTPTPSPIPGSFITVNTLTDEFTSTGDLCSLREAIALANSNAASANDCTRSGVGVDDVIMLTSGSTYTLSLAGTTSTTGDLDIGSGTSGNLIIQANGSASAVIDGGGLTPTDRVIDVATTGDTSLTLTNITIQNGNTTGQSTTTGGGIRFGGNGTLSVINSIISNNIAANGAGCGAGIFNNTAATVNITSSTISGNDCSAAGSDGGGVFKGTGGTLNITNSTINNNHTADNGGGVHITTGTANIINSTFANNSSDNRGGGLQVGGGTVTIEFSTFSDNTANGAGGNAGGAIQVNNGSVSVFRSILANSIIGLDCDQTAPGTVAVANSLIENNMDCTGAFMVGDPSLGALADNGGPTKTMAITNTSLAFDAATSCAGMTSDQRGASRPQGISCDLGAFESGSVVPTHTPTNTAIPTSTITPTFTATNTSVPTDTHTPTSTPIPTDTPTPGPSFTPTETLAPTATFTPTHTLVPTSTLTPTTVPDVIFADGFESGSFSAWTSNANDLGDLSVSSVAVLVGSQGMQAVIDDATSIYVNDDSPNAEPRYRARFYFDPNSITMASNDAHFIFKGFMGTATDVLQVEFRNSAGAYQIRAKILNDSSAFVVTNWFNISDASHSVEVDWRAATGVGTNNGGLTLWIDGVQQADLIGVDNDTWRIDRVRLGALAGMDAGTSGTYYFDAFESRRQNFIGP